MIVCYYLFRNIVKMTKFLNDVFMEIKRERYLEMLRNRKQNGFVKVITGIRRCGKSYLLNTPNGDD